ncbi:uncharacterized protein LOC125238977 [Leguminivora glycinivorella]|uniref:uncharacterized protein LOC125238977 n=1 Tax=Leguminivora glycinivorella TaxID=1035111 RepID=UPI00200D61DD|nr:uncharacterized protein LOC125238977 [Leguminivora glycinivorella]
MKFFDKGVVGHTNSFTQNDLLQYVEALMKESAIHQQTEGNYSWLKSRQTQHDYSKDLEAFIPMVSKMSPESCAYVAVKLDKLTEDGSTTVLGHFRRLLLEQDSMRLIEGATRRDRVRPDLGERRAVVSFILEKECTNSFA